jgi:hypothetical protein
MSSVYIKGHYPPDRISSLRRRGNGELRKSTTHHGLRAAVGFYCAQLFLAVLLGMSLYCLFSMSSAMNYVAPRGVSVVCRLFVMSSIVMPG